MKPLSYTTMLFSLLLLISFNSCDMMQADKGAAGISEEPQMNNYLEVYKKLRSETPDLLKSLNEEQDISGHEQYSNYEQIISNGGFSGSAQFIDTNKKMGMGYSILLALNKSEIAEHNQNSMDDMAKFIQESLDDPDVPEAQKAELRKKLAEVNKGKKSLQKFDQNEVWAKTVVKMANRVGNMAITLEEAKMMVKHEKDIKAAYEGFTMPPAIVLPHIDVDELE